MISGKYLGEIVRHALKELVQKGVLFQGESSPVLDKFEGFTTVYVSTIEKW